jgi:VIT1/CCC1 family predicted Fe2+/Mn2+ transporter
LSDADPPHPHPSRYTRERWHRAGQGESLRNFVFGTSDGLITVLAFVAGVSASLAQRHLVLLAGLSEMFAGALSMGLGAFLGARAERDLYHRERAREMREVREVPHLERDELRQIYRKKGFEGDELERVVDVLTATTKRWVDVMMAEELGLARPTSSATKAGVVVGLSYLVAASVPLLPYLFLPMRTALFASVVLTGVVLLAVGVGKARFTNRPPLRGAIETLLAGWAGTAVCWGIGQLASHLLGSNG